MFCSKCGKEVDDKSDFCNHCGNNLKNEKIENLEDSKNENLEDSKIEKFIKEFLADKTKVIIAVFSMISVILSMIFMSEMSLSTIPSIYMITLCAAGIINIAFSCNFIEKNNYKNDLLLLSGGLVFIGSALRIVQMGINSAWADLAKYVVIAIVMLLYIYKFLNNKGKENIISILLGGISIYAIYLFITLKLPFVKTFMWKIYNLAEATLLLSYIFVLKKYKNKFNEVPNTLKYYKKQIPKMKIVLLILTVITLITSGIGFLKNSNDEINYNNSSDIEISSTNNSIGKKEYKPTKDLVVEVSTLDSDRREAISIVKNNSEKTIKEYTLANIGFDSNGNNVKLGYDEVYELTSFESANILPGNVHGIDKYSYISEDIFYVISTVVKITYMDGSTWEAEAVEKWAEDEIKNFSVEKYKKKIESYSVESNNAVNNGYIQIVTTDKYHDNQFSTKDDLDVTVKNIGSKDIRSFSLLIAQYDQNGYGVNTSPYDIIKQNMSGADVDDANLKVGGTDEFSWSLFFAPDCKEYKIIVNEIEFSDGTTWKNPYLLQWILYNEDKR